MVTHSPHSVSQAFWRAMRFLALGAIAIWQLCAAAAQGSIVFEKATYLGDALQETGFRMAGVSIKTTATGRATGSFKMQDRTLALRGQFSPTGNFSQTFPATRKFPEATLTLTMSADAREITGQLTVDGASNWELFTQRTKSGTRKEPVEEQGYYTAITVESTAHTASTPLCVTVSHSGSVRIAGRYADGAPFTAGSQLTSDSNVPVFISLYRKTGFISGTATIDLEDNRYISGAFTWAVIVPPDPAEPDEGESAFTDEFEVFGAPYTAPARGERILDDFDIFDGEAFAQAYVDDDIGLVTIPFTWTERNVAIIGDPNEFRVRLTFQPRTGLFSGQFKNVDGRTTKFYGICIQDDEPEFDYAVGFYYADEIATQIDIRRPDDLIEE
jgi:hypothetical protein